jgi:hypothetical protein
MDVASVFRRKSTLVSSTLIVKASPLRTGLRSINFEEFASVDCLSFQSYPGPTHSGAVLLISWLAVTKNLHSCTIRDSSASTTSTCP